MLNSKNSNSYSNSLYNYVSSLIKNPAVYIPTILNIAVNVVEASCNSCCPSCDSCCKSKIAAKEKAICEDIVNSWDGVYIGTNQIVSSIIPSLLKQFNLTSSTEIIKNVTSTATSLFEDKFFDKFYDTFKNGISEKCVKHVSGAVMNNPNYILLSICCIAAVYMAFSNNMNLSQKNDNKTTENKYNSNKNQNNTKVKNTNTTTSLLFKSSKKPKYAVKDKDISDEDMTKFFTKMQKQRKTPALLQ